MRGIEGINEKGSYPFKLPLSIQLDMDDTIWRKIWNLNLHERLKMHM